ncbi:MAG: RnfH family protein [Betaproteobacteria bacterium]|jgi:putative ubiquitin-RnfH superfamily antitoxin RatB of RatAB toxin-antitoxin module|nr:RnfH family protein [Betaproteobacteria bacterium]
MGGLRVDVVYALSEAQTVVQVLVRPGATVRDAVAASGVLRGLSPSPAPQFGIFGRRVSPERQLADGDRIEIYRPLRVDPRVARRARAKAIRGRGR